MMGRWLGISIILSTAAFIGKTSAQNADSLDSGHEKGYPWIAHSSFEAFYLGSPTVPSISQPYQISLYQGMTIQSLSFASFHLGLRSRETVAPGIATPYREPFALKLAGTAEVLRNYLYLTLGGNIPILSGSISNSDSLALYQTINEYSPLPASGFLSPRALQVGVFSRYTWTAWSAFGGFTYVRPTRYKLIPNEAFYPAPYFDLVGRALLETGVSRHRFDAKTTFYSSEENDQRIPAHDEGDLWQLHYGYLKSYSKVALQGGLGFAARLPDANRKLKLKSELEKSVTNDNIQRGYSEFSLTWVPHPDILWRFHLLPKILFSVKGAEVGHETELGAGVGLKIWEVHRIRGGATLLYGNFAGKQYTGFGIRAEFAFRHLGFQDLESQSDINEGAP
jgi:hypothetical protein